MKTISTDVFEYHELDKAAQSNARAWYIGTLDSDDISRHIVDEDAKSIGLLITSWDLYRNSIEGKFESSPEQTADKIVREHGESCETHQTAKAYLMDRQAIIDAYEARGEEFEGEDADTEKLANSFLNDILRDYLRMLRAEDEFLQSEDNIKEAMESMAYTFTQDGKRFG